MSNVLCHVSGCVIFVSLHDMTTPTQGDTQIGCTFRGDAQVSAWTGPFSSNLLGHYQMRRVGLDQTRSAEYLQDHDELGNEDHPKN